MIYDETIYIRKNERETLLIKRRGHTDANKLDSLAREVGSNLTRRGVLGALVSMATILTVASPDAEARGKRRKRRRKGKCKQSQKKCGKKCIGRGQCCDAADCGAAGSCIKGVCTCPAGQKACDGGCIADAACCRHQECAAHQECSSGSCVDSGLTRRCGDEVISRHQCCAGACPGNQTCVDDICTCPVAGTQPCPDGSCVAGGQCCEHHQCDGDHQCLDGYCACPNADHITCDDDCCVSSDDEICQYESTGSICAGGGCQPSDWCNTAEWHVCADHGPLSCTCITSFNGADDPSVCVDYYSLYPATADCEICNTSTDCGEGSVCIQGSNDANSGHCSCEGKFCARLCDTEASLSQRQRGGSVADAEARIAAFPRAKRRPGSQ